MHSALAIARDIGLRYIESSTQLHLGQILTTLDQHALARQALDAATAIADELGGALPAFEVHAAQAELLLAAGGPDAAAQALAALDTLVQTLLDPQTDQTGPRLSLHLHHTAHRVLAACGDPRAVALLARARAELRLRSERIADTTTRRDYLQVAEHRALAQGS